MKRLIKEKKPDTHAKVGVLILSARRNMCAMGIRICTDPHDGIPRRSRSAWWMRIRIREIKHCGNAPTNLKKIFLKNIFLFKIYFIKLNTSTVISSYLWLIWMTKCSSSFRQLFTPGIRIHINGFNQMVWARLNGERWSHIGQSLSSLWEKEEKRNSILGRISCNRFPYMYTAQCTYSMFAIEGQEIRWTFLHENCTWVKYANQVLGQISKR